MREDRRFIDNVQSLKPFLAKVKKLGKKTAKTTSAIDLEWERVVPKDRLPFTSVVSFRTNVLTVRVNNPVIRSEMEMSKRGLIDALNAGTIIFVRELHFKIG